MLRYARVELALVVLVAVGSVLLFACGQPAVGSGLVVLAAALIWFYRDPPRTVLSERRGVLAPADGRITRVETEPSGDVRLVIFLSLWDVHINRAPCAGVVRRIEHRPGRFLNALFERSERENESNVVEIEPDGPIEGVLVVRQIAGFLARRIVCRLRVGERVAAGERFGMIKLGSRTELRLSGAERWRVLVRVGQRVYAGRTLLALYDAELPKHSSEA